MKLICAKGDVQGLKVLVTATYAETKLDLLEADVMSDAFLQKSPFKRLPVLETGINGLCISGANSICCLLARLKSDKFLYGENVYQNAEVDMWMDFCSSELENSVFSWIKNNKSNYENNVKEALALLDKHLLSRTYLVGHRVSVCDVCICVIISHGMKASKITEAMLKNYVNVYRWFNTITSNKIYVGALESLVFVKGKTPEKPSKTANKQTADKQDTDDDTPAPEPKPKCELDLLPPSKMNLTSFKVLYSNEKDLNGKVMSWLWSNFDAEGYSFYKMTYEKLEGECEISYVTSNQLGGFLQRIDNNFRKYAFGVLNVLGKDKAFDIMGVWMWRGQGIPSMITDHPSCEYHKWMKLDPLNKPEDKQLIIDYFCNSDEVEGRPIADCKVYK